MLVKSWPLRTGCIVETYPSPVEQGGTEGGRVRCEETKEIEVTCYQAS